MKEAKENEDHKAHQAAETNMVGKQKDTGEHQGSDKLSPGDTTRCLALAARANFRVVDRGCLFAAQELT